MTTLTSLWSLAAHGETETLGLKRSTAELLRAGETLSALLNAEDCIVIFGVADDSAIFDQAVSHRTRRVGDMIDDRPEEPPYVFLRFALQPRDNRQGGAV